jgi:chaperonin cofactor prefoldin
LKTFYKLNDKFYSRIEQQIKDIEKILNALGYIESNGSIAKIV